MRRPFVAGNWKMNGSRERTRALVAGVCEASRGLPGVDVGVCPPFVYLAEAGAVTSGALLLGGQNCARTGDGAFTGEVSARMLADAGCSFVLVGHSERRTLYGERDAEVAEKTALALAAGLSPVVCVGETLDEREAGRTEATVTRQLDAVIEHLDREALARVVFAYEPVWAIGTGRTATPADAGEMHRAARAVVAELAGAAAAQDLVIQYGGSVKPDNAAALLACDGVDGLLVGGASLAADSFARIVAAARTPPASGR